MDIHNQTVAAFSSMVESNKAKGLCYACGKEPMPKKATCQEHSSVEKQAVRLFGKPKKKLDIVPALVYTTPINQEQVSLNVKGFSQ